MAEFTLIPKEDLKALPWTQISEGKVQLRGKFDVMQVGQSIVLNTGLAVASILDPQRGDAILTVYNTYKDTAANIMKRLGFNVEASPTIPTPQTAKPQFPKAES